MMKDLTGNKIMKFYSLVYTARGPLVILFYDGYELQANPGFWGGILSQLRRMLRYGKRSLCRQQVRTGFYSAFLALVQSLRRIGCDVRINDFAAARTRPHYPIGIAGYPTVIQKIDLPNPRIFGPGDFGTPPAAVSVAIDPRFKLLIQPSDWFSEVYRPFCGDKMVTWFAGIDTQAWPDFADTIKDIDFVVYDKIRWHREQRVPSILDRIKAFLDRNGRSYVVLRYGHHHHAEFRRSLSKAKALIFVCEHETQGLAYQEALATNVPVLAWDEGEMIDPTLQPYVPKGTNVSAVPYFDENCGMRFKLSEFELVCEKFWENLPNFRPRHYVETHLSLEMSANHYLALYARMAEDIA